MSQDEALRLVQEGISVTPQKVAVAKAIILDACTQSTETDKLLDAVMQANDAALPRQLVLHSTVDSSRELAAASEALSWRLAASEAVLSLIHSGFLIALSIPQERAPHIPWTTVVGRSGGTSGGWSFDSLFFPLPGRVRPAPSLVGTSNQFLSEPDLYLNTLSITNMHLDIQDAFREAIKCFRNDLFTATITMLGKASEGAWLELGASLLAYVPASEQASFSKPRTILEDPMIGTFRKIEAVIAIFDRQDIFKPLAQSSGIRVQELRAVEVWSDAVRDSRNTIHFGVSPTVPNTYEKISALLIGAVANFRVLYKLKEAADTTASP